MSRLCRLLLPAVLAVLAVLPLHGQSDKPKGKKYALLVGITDYDHGKLDPLKYTENDVEELAETLARKPAGFSSVRLLTTSRGARQPADKPTGKNIRAAFKELLAKKTRHDTLVVALSGHGLELKVKGKDEAFFCPSDAQIADATTMIALKAIFDQLDDSGAGVKLLLVDACRNDPKLGRNVDVDNLPRPPRGTAALFSCASGQRAFETAKLGKGHGVFFHFVLKGLAGEAKNKRGEVTWDGLTEYVKEKVSDEVPILIGDGAKQSPHKIENLVGKSPVLLQSDAEDLAREFTNSIGMKLVLIPRGKFMMGSTTAEQDGVLKSVSERDRKILRNWVKTEGPRHEVEISKPFYLGVYTVTQEQYKEVMGENPSWFSATGRRKDQVRGLNTDDFPVEWVSWHEAKKFCEKLSGLPAERRHGRTYRLPTEAEWEYACRGGAPSSNPFHFGKSLSSREANINGNVPYGGAAKGPYLGRTSRVGSYKPNAFGLYDMHGNVWQWCNDWYGEGYYKDGPAKDPQGPAKGTERVIRGGSWVSYGWTCRTAFRGKPVPGFRNGDIGFRVACSRSSRTP
jgi:formylglycine-generating enzyme required for sulfatase activity